MKKSLDRTLGYYSALTISVGTMIGSAIFVLAGTSYATAGPSASLSIFLAGFAALMTGFSFAELVTLIPNAGGGYAYVREATNNGVLSFLCGWGFLLGYAMSCGLFALGFGNFLNYFFPFIPQMAGSYLLTIYIVYTNIRGVKSSGKLQDVITTGLILLLLVYIIYGLFHIDIKHQVPFFPNGTGGMLNAMGFLYMTYIGYGLITTASEEVIDPTRTIPKAIIVSILFVILIKTATFFVGASIIPWTKLLPSVTRTPLTDTAVKIAGPLGGYLFALAGILATLSSINTAVMASSRTAFALARDQRFPAVFKTINSSTRTPIFAVVFTGLIVLASVSIRNLEHISTITSIFSLTGYTLVNFALIIFRIREPHKTRQFKAPLYPVTPILGITLNIFLVSQLAKSDVIALSIAIIIILLGLSYFYWALPRLKSAPKGISPLDIPHYQNPQSVPDDIGEKIVVPVANPSTMAGLMALAARLSEHEKNTAIVPLHVMSVPNIISMDAEAYKEIKTASKIQDKTMLALLDYEASNPLVKPLLVYSRDVVHAIILTVKEIKANLLLMGWHPSGLASKMQGGIVENVIKTAPVTVGILKANQTCEYKRVLFPYGGGRYSQLTAEIVRRVAHAYTAEVTVLKVIDDWDGHNSSVLEEEIRTALKELGTRIQVRIEKGDLIDKVVDISSDYDLLILGASLDWGFKEYITGFRSDSIAEKARCSVLIVKSYQALLQRKGVRRYLEKLKNLLH